MKTYERVIETLKEKRNRILSGNINCIPYDLPRFSSLLPGIEHGKYIIVTANQKVGKSQITDWLYMYTPLWYAYNNRDKCRLKIFYFTFEMSVEEKYNQAICYMLYKLSNGTIHIAPIDLRSTNANKPLPEAILNILDTPEYKSLLEFFEESVTFIDSVRHPTGINIFLEEYAKNNGIIHKKRVSYKDKEVFDYYEKSDPNEYRIVIFDHLSLLSPEKGMSLRENIGILSSVHFVKLRNYYKYTIVAVQQQAQAQESIDNYKLNKLKPSVDGLAENKTTARDADIVLGLYTPFRYGIREYEGYEIVKFRDFIRFLEIIAGREGGGGNICPLYFDGAVNYFKELPLPTDTSILNRVYALIQNIQNINSGIPGVININIKQPDESTRSSKVRIWKIFKYWTDSRTWH